MRAIQQVLYSDRTRSPHSTRFITELSKKFDVVEHYEEDGVSPNLNLEFVFVFVATINISRPWLRNVKAPIVSISWFFDINNSTFSSISEKNPALDNKEIYRTLSKVVIVDCMTAKKLLIAEGFEESKILVFPYGINLDHYKYSEQRNPGLNIKLVSTRNWEENYNIDTVLEAVRILDCQFPGLFSIQLAGHGSLFDKFDSRYSDLISRKIISKLGSLGSKDMVALLTSCDIYLSASSSDGISVSMLEAQALGLPVIVSRIPSNLEWIAEGETGFLHEVGSPTDLANVIAKVATRKSCVEISKAARSKIERHANFPENFNKFVFSFIQNMSPLQ
jgi:glycosyltransferase involved in cell wall biosynthesis